MMSSLRPAKERSSILLGSVFLMATSAIGPGFITQTTVFTEKLGPSFGFVILCSVLIDIVVQLNIWRIVSASGMRAQDLANRIMPGSGYLLAFLIAAGGLAFNIGNIAGAGLGIQVIAGVDLYIGVIISVVISLLIFWYKEAGKAVDWFAKILGILMIALTAYIALSSQPPILETLKRTLMPNTLDTTATIILVGGTVGGYISFAGVHRLLDAGITGADHIREVSRSSVRAILVASTMRVLLFLAALGVVYAGVTLDAGNPAASVFKSAAGEIGFKVFGVVLWCASITSVVGSAYTSVSFLKSFHRSFERNQNLTISFFILFSAVIFMLIGKPVTVLVVVGALNEFVLPVALFIFLRASRVPDAMGGYSHPLWLVITGWLVFAVLTLLSFRTFFDLTH